MICSDCGGDDPKCFRCDGSGELCDVCGEACPEPGQNVCSPECEGELRANEDTLSSSAEGAARE